MNRHVGCHLSITKGVDKCIEDIQELGGTCFQIFLRNPQSINLKPVSDKRIEEYKILHKKLNENGIKCVIHSPYVINFCLPSDHTFCINSKQILIQDLNDAEMIGAIGCVIHLGKNTKELSYDDAITTFTDNVIDCLKRTPESTRPIIIETGAGQGTEFGWKLKTLGKMFARIQLTYPTDRVKFCIDTCHVFSAGYNLVDDFDRFIGLVTNYLKWDNVICVHVNDSKTCCGSFVDRHEDPDHGFIGMDTLKRFVDVCHTKNENIIFVLETPATHMPIQQQIMLIS